MVVVDFEIGCVVAFDVVVVKILFDVAVVVWAIDILKKIELLIKPFNIEKKIIF